MPSPCPCRGCVTAYKVGVEEGKGELREARRQSYRDGYNDAIKAQAQSDWVYTGDVNPRGRTLMEVFAELEDQEGAT